MARGSDRSRGKRGGGAKHAKAPSSAAPAPPPVAATTTPAPAPAPALATPTPTPLPTPLPAAEAPSAEPAKLVVVAVAPATPSSPGAPAADSGPAPEERPSAEVVKPKPATSPKPIGRVSAPPDSAHDAPPRRPGGRGTRLAGAIFVALLMALTVYTINAMRAEPPPSRVTVFDPTVTNREELRRVAEAVSRIIAATPERHESAVEALEALRVESAGARDLKDACVNTYRGMIRADARNRELRAILVSPDGGARPTGSIPPGDLARANTAEADLREQLELVAQSRERCHTLYESAVRELGITAARRPARP